MLFRTHLVFGLLVGLLFVNFFDVGNRILFLGFVLFFSISPDIDHGRSFIGRRFFILSKIINFIFGHRKLIHSLFFALVIYFVFRNFGFFDLGRAALVGFFSHIVMDGLTVDGVRFLYPLKYKLRGFVRSGSFFETILFYFFIVVMIVLFGFKG